MFRTRYEKYIEFEELQKPTGLAGIFDFVKVAIALIPGVGPPVAGTIQATQTLIQTTKTPLVPVKGVDFTAAERKLLDTLMARLKSAKTMTMSQLWMKEINKLKSKVRSRVASQQAAAAAYAPTAPAYLTPLPSDGIEKLLIPVGIGVAVLGGGFLLLSAKKKKRRRRR